MKKKNQIFEITDLNKFVECSRVLVFDSMGKQHTSSLDDMKYTLAELSEEEATELNEMLTQEEAMIICKDFMKHDGDTYLISNKRYVDLIDSLNSRLISNMLNNLVNKGLLETGFDHESNDFIFWIKDNENNNEEENKKS
jgi:hypothetical protein